MFQPSVAYKNVAYKIKSVYFEGKIGFKKSTSSHNCAYANALLGGFVGEKLLRVTVCKRSQNSSLRLNLRSVKVTPASPPPPPPET